MAVMTIAAAAKRSWMVCLADAFFSIVGPADQRALRKLSGTNTVLRRATNIIQGRVTAALPGAKRCSEFRYNGHKVNVDSLVADGDCGTRAWQSRVPPGHHIMAMYMASSCAKRNASQRRAHHLR